MHSKRKREDAESRSIAPKRVRHRRSPDLISPLSDELLVRILSFLPLTDLLSCTPVSNRFYNISGDSQLWKQLYYSQFVLPRALRIPGLRDGDGKIHYSAHRMIWADGRRGGWVDTQDGRDRDSHRSWKRQYKLRHNWARGNCAVEELQVGPEVEADASRKMLVKVSEGIAVTVDRASGLQAWDLKTKRLLAQISLDGSDPAPRPSCIAIDEQNLNDNVLQVAIGFDDGSFGLWGLDLKSNKLMQRHRHEKSSNGELVGIAVSIPYLFTATRSVLLSLYTFDVPESSSKEVTEASVKSNKTSKDQPQCQVSDRSCWNTVLTAPYLLTSLKSHTSRAPLALSLRKTTGYTVASIAYTFETMQGWSLGIQDIYLRPSVSNPGGLPEVTTRLAYSPYSRRGREPIRIRQPSESPHGGERPSREAGNTSGPINLCYTHPYVLVTLPDNTLLLYVCTSTASSLTISPGRVLWGHTSGISDAEITARGKAVSVSSRGEEIRVWELEGQRRGKGIEVRPTTSSAAAQSADEDDEEGDEEQRGVWESARGELAGFDLDERRNWVGFDDEMVIVLKECRGRESLLVYDFT